VKLRHQQSGLSLIELIVVIAIIALLTSAAIPSYQNHIQRKNIALARVDIQSIELAIVHYDVTMGGLPDDLAKLRMDDMLNPWGQPYEFLNHTNVKGNGQFRKFKGEVPLNSDYDLYSIGPDSASNGPLTAATSRDDIVRAANDAFVGLGANFGDFGNSDSQQ